MALAPTASKPDTDAVSQDIQDELSEIRKDLAALAKSVATFGRLKAGDASERMQHTSEELLANSRQAVKEMRTQLDGIEKTLEQNVREHPMTWFLGAFGAGILLTLLARRPH